MQLSYFSSKKLTETNKNKIVENAYLYLTKSDIKQICKNRGFPNSVNADPKLLSHYILLNTGLEKVLKSLSKKEIIALFIIHIIDKIPDVRFFINIYDENFEESYYNTFNQNYKDLHKKVINNLIRKGILLPVFVSNYNAKSKLEQTYFYLPDEFLEYINPISLITNEKIKGTIDYELLKKDFLRVLNNSLSQSSGVLKQGASYFSVYNLRDNLFERMLKKKNNSTIISAEFLFFNKVFLSFFKKIKKNTWFNISEIDTIVNILFANNSNVKLTGKAVCDVAYKCGVLKKHPVDNKLYATVYHSDYEFLSPDEYLTDNIDGIALNIKKLPFVAAEVLSLSSIFNFKGGKYFVSPSITLINSCITKLKNDEVFMDICKKFPAFNKVISDHKRLYGKRIIHRNLYVAKVDDLSIRIMLEKKFTSPNQLVKLNDNHYAFPINNRKDIETMLKRSGHVIKVII